MSACRFSLTLNPSDNNSASSSHCPAIDPLAVAFARVLSHPHALCYPTAVLPYHEALTYIRARRRTTHHRRLPARHTLEQARPSTQYSQTQTIVTASLSVCCRFAYSWTCAPLPPLIPLLRRQSRPDLSAYVSAHCIPLPACAAHQLPPSLIQHSLGCD